MGIASIEYHLEFSFYNLSQSKRIKYSILFFESAFNRGWNITRFQEPLIRRLRTMSAYHKIYKKSEKNADFWKWEVGKSGLTQGLTIKIIVLKSPNELNCLLEKIEKIIKAYVKEESEKARLLMSVPGIGYFSALLLAAEIGDINRFRSYRKLCSYSGVVSRTEQSAETVHQGPHLCIFSN